MCSVRRRIRKAVIPVAGLGTRFLPATKAIPKEMIPIIDKPMIQYIVEECVLAGIEQIIFVTARGKDSLLDHFDHSFEIEHTLKQKEKKDLLQLVESVSKMADVITIRQKQPLGLGHAVLTSKSIVQDEPFAVLLGDDLVVSKVPCIKQLIEVFEEQQTSVIGVMEVPKDELSKYGIIGGKKISDKLYKVDRMLEKPKASEAPTQLACPGRYVLTPRVFDFLSHSKLGKGGELQLTDSLSKLSTDEGLYAYLFEGKRYDTGDRLGYIEATIAFALERPDLSDGVRKILKHYTTE